MRSKANKINNKGIDGSHNSSPQFAASRGRKTSRNGVYFFSFSLFLIGMLVVLALFGLFFQSPSSLQLSGSDFCSHIAFV